MADPSNLPADWLVVGPHFEFQFDWERQLVHLPTVMGHNLYLIGLTVICVALAVRGTFGRRAVVGGLAVSIAGIVVQLAVSPV